VLVSMTFGSRSHIKNIFEIGKVLQTRGHSVSYMAIEPYLRFADGFNFTRHQVGPNGLVVDDHRGISEINQIPVNPLIDTVNALIDHLPAVFRLTFTDILRLVDEIKPDVMICDFFSPSCIDAAYHRRIPLITGFQTLDGSIIPPPYITSPLFYFPTTVDALSFPMRFYSTVIHPLMAASSFITLNRKLNAERARYGLEQPYFTNVGNWENSLKLCNTFVGFESARPLDPSMKLIGPVMSDDFLPLTTELQHFLNSKKRVLYIAFGSGVALSNKDVQLLLQAVAQLVTRGKADGVVWALGKTPRSTFNASRVSVQVDGESIFPEEILNNAHPKIHLVNWAPQVAILSHEAVRLFLSHGGLESVFEAVHSGTPILAMPFFGDQYRNARKVVEMGFGGYSDRFTQTSQSIYKRMSSMLEDKDGTIANAILHWQVIARMNAKHKVEAANLIEEYVLTSRFCRKNNPNLNSFACEISHLVPGYHKMNPLIAFGVDVFSALILLGILFPTLSFLFIRSVSRAFRNSQKPLTYNIIKKDQ
ncbi:hypothetical protein L0F63_005054, partial [Massospora cicadina]